MPFCPACRSEYRPEFTRCTDCNAELVAAAPPAPPKSWPRRLIDRFIRTFGIVAFLLLVLAILGWAAGVLSSWRHASECETSVATLVAGVTRVKVWAAGARSSPDKFCHACSFGHPTQVYETTDAAEIAALQSALRFGAVWSPLPEGKVAACGPITVDFLRGEILVLSVNLHGRDVDASIGARWNAPLSSGGRRDVDAWLARHSLRERVYQIRSDFMNAKR